MLRSLEMKRKGKSCVTRSMVYKKHPYKKQLVILVKFYFKKCILKKMKSSLNFTVFLINHTVCKLRVNCGPRDLYHKDRTRRIFPSRDIGMLLRQGNMLMTWLISRPRPDHA